MDGSDPFGSAMGGTPGDGLPQQQQQYYQQPSTPGYGPTQTPANTPQAPGATPYPRGGSITQFATPSMQQQQQQMYPQSSSYDFSPPPRPSAANNTNLSYAERAALLQKQQQQPPQHVYTPTPQPSQGGLFPQAQQAALYSRQAQPSPSQQQHYQPQQQQQNGMSFAERSQAMYQQPAGYSPQRQNQQQQQYPPPVPPPQQPGMSYHSSQGSNSMASAPAPQPMSQQQPQQQYAAGSFAQRSAMMQQQLPQPSNQYGGGGGRQQPAPNQYQYQQQQQQQPQYGGGMPQQQQPQPQYGGGAGGNYAQRSSMTQSGMGPPQPQGQLQQPGMPPAMMPGNPPVMAHAIHQPMPPQKPLNPWDDPPDVVAQQQRLLTDATRKVQEHAYYMKQAMERNDLPAVMDRAACMVGELGEHAHAHHQHRLHPPPPGATGTTTSLSPKNYYELHLRALEELPTLEDYLLNMAQGFNGGGGLPQQQLGPPPQEQGRYTMKELYDSVQFCPSVLSRLYLQICAGSALIRSGEVGAKWVMKDVIEAVKCVQNPVRGLFLRHYLLQVFKDKLPDEPIPMDEVGPPMSPLVAQPPGRGETNDDGKPPGGIAPNLAVDANNLEKGNVKDSYRFILANFIEMNKLWVRIQHLPGDGKSKDVRRRRERERNDLRVLVGTNMVRLSALDSVTSSIYGQVILPTVLDHIVISADPLAQAYLIDCITQVFPDEYHIETMPILLGVCPKLRDKVNIRTILQSLMDRLANYLADEELLDEKDSNEVKKSLANDSFGMFDDCVQKVYNARGPKLQAKEVVRLQTALLAFSKKCYAGNREQIVLCLNHCVVALQQASANQALMNDYQGNNIPQQPPPRVPLDEVATKELEKLLSIPLEDMGLGVLSLEHYSDLIAFLPWMNRRQVALTMLEAISNKGTPPDNINELEQLFNVIAPVLRNEHDAPPPRHQTADATDRTTNLMAGLGVSASQQQPGGYQSQSQFDEGSPEDSAVVSKLIHLLNHEDTDVVYEMLSVARKHLSSGRANTSAYTALVFSSLKLAKRIFDEERGEPTKSVGAAPVNQKDKITGTEDDLRKLTMKQMASILRSYGMAQKDIDTLKRWDRVHVIRDLSTKAASSEPKPKEEAKPAKDDDGTSEEDKESGDPTEAEEKDDGDQETKEEGESKEESKEDDTAEEGKDETEDKGEVVSNVVSTPKSVSCRKVLIFTQETIDALSKSKPETGIKLYLEAALITDKYGLLAKDIFGPISYELISQSFALYEANAGDSRLQIRCVKAIIGTLVACRCLSKEDYEGLIMKTAQYAAKMLKKPDQCEMVALCSNLFYVVDENDSVIYANPQRCLECLQRALKLADACTSANPANVGLFVDLLEHYLYFFEKKNPSITGNYITGLVALVKEHTDNLIHLGGAVSDAKQHFRHIVRHIKAMKEKSESAEYFTNVDTADVASTLLGEGRRQERE
eukprot:scaffold2353_cov134-Cylindrotheca_fusiformis.AAC.6